MVGKLVQLKSGQVDYIEDDYFGDPWGDEPEVILLQPGFVRHSQFFYHWVPLIAKKYRFIRRDLRGHHKSSVPGPGYEWSNNKIGEEVVELLDALGIQKVHFLAESTVGMLALHLATQIPDRLSSVTLMSCPLKLHPNHIDLFKFEFGNWEECLRQTGGRGWTERMTSNKGTMGNRDPRYREWYLTQCGDNPTEGLIQYASFIKTVDNEHCLKEIDNVPFLFLAPTNSVAASRPEQEMMANTIKGAKLVWIDGAGHETFVDKAEDCIEQLDKFISSLSLSSTKE